MPAPRRSAPRPSLARAPAWLLALALAGCAGAPPGDVPPLDVPAAWRHDAGAAGDPAGPGWWRRFGSGELAALIEQARGGSFDLAAAAARVRQAQAQARIAGAPLLPEVSLSATAQRLREPQASVTGYYTAELFATYEIDLWGGNAAARDSALATLQGTATPLELAQQRGLVATQRQDLEQRRQEARGSLTALAILLGRPAPGFDIAASTLDGIAMPTVAAGVPAGLIVHRPDLAQAERALAAADADIVAARAAMLPSLTLTAGAGVGADRLRDLLDTSLYSLAAGLAAPIFNAGRLAAGRDFAIARREELLAAYRGAIVNAFGDVENALNAVDGLTRQRDAQAEALAQAREAARLAESRYRAGAETLLTVLDAQRTLYAAQDNAVQLHLAQLQASVGLFRALGGGWEDGAAAGGGNLLSRDARPGPRG
ncbi:TolC family protein [Cupriavidus basilensis]|uniref:TolC family protein n=1 Tax=Cupriavidus basilensis TaxID=68895 RepID=UPI0007511970|nr:TolC family protein [Cupriavidus basilensis]